MSAYDLIFETAEKYIDYVLDIITDSRRVYLANEPRTEVLNKIEVVTSLHDAKLNIQKAKKELETFETKYSFDDISKLFIAQSWVPKQGNLERCRIYRIDLRNECVYFSYQVRGQEFFRRAETISDFLEYFKPV